MQPNRIRTTARHLATALVMASLMYGLGILAWMLLLEKDNPAAADPGPIDVGFAQFMSLHHEQAVQMAGILLARPGSQLSGLAQNIQTTQLLEIGQMQGWLNLWGKPLLPPNLSMDWMRLAAGPYDPAVARYLLDCETSPGGMPGLATAEQLQRLRTLSGAELDILFLRLMIDHHRGGMPMARFASANAQIDTVRSLAKRMFVAQNEELRLMTEKLKRMQAASGGG